MGIGFLILSDGCVDGIVRDLRTSGFEVDVREASMQLGPEDCRVLGTTYPQEPHTYRQIECRRGGEKIVLSVDVGTQQLPGYRIYIPNRWSWRPSRHRELVALQADVTAILEANGAYSPFDDEVKL